MALYAIGDIHGHTKLLKALISAISLSDEDTLVFTGDYVDKGPDVKGTIDFLIEVDSLFNCVFLMGNHDQSLLDAYDDTKKIAIWECLAGELPIVSYGKGNAESVLSLIPLPHINFLRTTCVNFYETDSYIFVHAGIRSYLSPVEEEIERLQWSSLSFAEPHISGKTVVCGHSAQQSGRIADLGHTICIDTGVTKGLPLTCLNLDDFSFVQLTHEYEVIEGYLRSE